MEKIILTHRVRNEELLQRVKEERIIVKIIIIKKEVELDWTQLA